LILQLEGIARGLSQEAVITVGRISCKPNAANVIPEEVEFTIDFRAPDNEVLARGDAMIQEQVTSVSMRRELPAHLVQTEDQPAVAMDEAICRKLMIAAAKHLGHDAPITVSGALHDSAIIAPYIPTAMVFVASKDGISHNPAEFSRVDDIALAARIVSDVFRAV